VGVLPIMVLNMKQTYELQVMSTGELIRREDSVKPLAVWWRRVEKKVLKDRRISEKYKQAIRTNDVAAGWVDTGDDWKEELTSQEIIQETRRVFRGVDKEIEKRVSQS